MSKYSFTFEGTRYPIQRSTFWLITIPVISAVVAWAGCFVYFGTSAVSYYTGLPSIVAALLCAMLLGSVTLTRSGGGEREYALFPPVGKRLLTIGLTLLTAVYVVSVRDWSWWETAVLFLPSICKALFKLLKAALWKS